MTYHGISMVESQGLMAKYQELTVTSQELKVISKGVLATF